MLGMIRSARSRLHRDTFEDGTAMKKSSGSTTTAAAGTIRSRGHALMRSRSSLGSRMGSENAAPEKPQVTTVTTSVLGDATNTYCTGYNLPQKPPATTTDAPCQLKANIAEPRFTQVAPTLPIPSDVEMDTTTTVPENAQQVTEYAHDIFQVLKREELVNQPSPNYMEKQQQVNAKMRGILIDWLVDVHRKYKLRPETLFLAVQVIDRYLDTQVTARRHLQLVGVTSLLIAAKFEEVYPPQIKDLVYVTDKAYSREDILSMEVSILKALQFKVCLPTAINFLEKYQSVNGCTDAHRDLAQYLLELTLVDYKMLKYAPSHLAAASILLSNKLLRRPSWTPAAVRQTKMTEAMLKSSAKEICDLLECAESNPLQAVRKKYSQLKHHSVAKLDFMGGPGAQDAVAVSLASNARKSTGGIMENA